MTEHGAYGNEGYCRCGAYLCPQVAWPGRASLRAARAEPGLDVERLQKSLVYGIERQLGRGSAVNFDSAIGSAVAEYARLAALEAHGEPRDDGLRESHRLIRRKGFPVHRPDDECYCDTCWSYLCEDVGGNPEVASEPVNIVPTHPDDADAKRRPIQTVGGKRVGQFAHGEPQEGE